MDYSQASCITSSSQEEINTVSAQQSKEREASGLLLSHMLGLNIDILKLHTVALIETTIVRVINNLKKGPHNSFLQTFNGIVWPSSG